MDIDILSKKEESTMEKQTNKFKQDLKIKLESGKSYNG